MTALRGKKILVVEDEAVLSMDISATIEDEGAEVAGPCLTLQDAMITAGKTKPHGAILDVDLQGELVFPLADYLAKENVPFVFHTGRAEIEVLKTRYAKAPVCLKPTPVRDLLYKLGQILGY